MKALQVGPTLLTGRLEIAQRPVEDLLVDVMVLPAGAMAKCAADTRRGGTRGVSW
jgi:hypothetical protein